MRRTMRKTLAVLGTSVMLSAVLTGCSDTTSSSEISSNENITEVSDTSPEKESTEGQTENETSEESEDDFVLTAQDVAENVSVKILACETVDFEDGDLTGEPENYPNANASNKATILTVLVMSETEFPSQNDFLASYDVDIDLQNEDGDNLGDYQWYADYVMDDSLRYSIDIDDAIRGYSATLYRFSVAGAYDADDIYICINASKYSYLTDETDEAGTTRKADTSSIGDFSAVPNILEIGDRTYKVNANGTGGGVETIGVEDGKEKITSNKKYTLLPLEGDLESDLVIDDIHLVTEEGYNEDYMTEMGYSVDLSLSGSNLKIEIALLVDKDLDLSSDEYNTTNDVFVEYINTYLTGFGTYDAEGNETIFEIEW